MKGISGRFLTPEGMAEGLPVPHREIRERAAREGIFFNDQIEYLSKEHAAFIESVYARSNPEAIRELSEDLMPKWWESDPETHNKTIFEMQTSDSNVLKMAAFMHLASDKLTERAKVSLYNALAGKSPKRTRIQRAKENFYNDWNGLGYFRAWNESVNATFSHLVSDIEQNPDQYNVDITEEDWAEKAAQKIFNGKVSFAEVENGFKIMFNKSKAKNAQVTKDLLSESVRHWSIRTSADIAKNPDDYALDINNKIYELSDPYLPTHIRKLIFKEIASNTLASDGSLLLVPHQITWKGEDGVALSIRENNGRFIGRIIHKRSPYRTFLKEPDMWLLANHEFQESIVENFKQHFTGPRRHLSNYNYIDPKTGKPTLYQRFPGNNTDFDLETTLIRILEQGFHDKDNLQKTIKEYKNGGGITNRKRIGEGFEGFFDWLGVPPVSLPVWLGTIGDRPKLLELVTYLELSNRVKQYKKGKGLIVRDEKTGTITETLLNNDQFQEVLDKMEEDKDLWWVENIFYRGAQNLFDAPLNELWNTTVNTIWDEGLKPYLGMKLGLEEYKIENNKLIYQGVLPSADMTTEDLVETGSNLSEAKSLFGQILTMIKHKLTQDEIDALVEMGTISDAIQEATGPGIQMSDQQIRDLLKQ